MSLTLGIAIYSVLVAFISSLMIHYYKVMYPREEAKLRDNK